VANLGFPPMPEALDPTLPEPPFYGWRDLEMECLPDRSSTECQLPPHKNLEVCLDPDR
jgi:hypothetical protein